MNNDGFLDIISLGASTVSVLLGQAGGSFGASINAPTGTGSLDVKTIDWNHDGLRDVVVANATANTVSFHLNVGAGGLSAATAVPAGTVLPLGLAIAEVTGDGLPDVVAITESGTPTHVAFAASRTATLPPASVTSTSSGGPRNVVVADFDSDGIADVAEVYHNASGLVGVLHGVGDGSFGATTTYAVAANPYALVAGDFNRDGHPDLATANAAGSVSVLLGRGGIGSDGSFASVSTDPAGSDPEALDSGDVDFDGWQEAAVANPGGHDVRVVQGMTNGAIGGSSTAWTAGADTPWSVKLVDVNGDQFLDLVSVQLNGDLLRVAPNQGDFTLNFGLPTFYPVGLDPFDIATGDFNRDGRTDIATANVNATTFSVLANIGSGDFGGTVAYGMGSSAAHGIVSGDVNNDGKLDMVLSSTVSGLAVSLGDGAGAFGAATSFAVGVDSYGVALADFNRDGRLDAAVTDQSNDTITIMLGNGAGAFALSGSYATDRRPRELAIADINRDGRMDAIVSNSLAGTITTHLGVGDGTMTAGPSFSAGGSLFHVLASDFNRDGTNDLRIVSQGTGTVNLFVGRRICLP